MQERYSVLFTTSLARLWENEFVHFEFCRFKLSKIFCDKNSFYVPTNMIFPGGSDGKESACNAGDLGLIPGLRRSPGEGHGNPLQYSCLESPNGQRSLAGCSPWSHKELDTTEWLSTHLQIYIEESVLIIGKNLSTRGKMCVSVDKR